MPNVKALLAFCVMLGSNWELKAELVYPQDDITYLTSHKSIRLLRHLDHFKMSVKNADFKKGYDVSFVAVNDNSKIEFVVNLSSRSTNGDYSDFEVSIENYRFISNSYFRIVIDTDSEHEVHFTKNNKSRFQTIFGEVSSQPQLAKTANLVYLLNLSLCDFMSGDFSTAAEATQLIKLLESKIEMLPVKSELSGYPVIVEGKDLTSVFIDQESVSKSISLIKCYLEKKRPKKKDNTQP